MEIRVDHLCKAFGKTQVLEQVCLDFEAGGIYCLMGPSGQGKTTLLRILMGLEAPDSGTVLVDNIPLAWNLSMKIFGLDQCRRKDKAPVDISAVFQEDRLCEWLDGVHNVAMVPVPVKGRERYSYARKHLSMLLPEDSIEKPVCDLSGGMRKRVAIARAVAAGSDVLLMDEPFGGLDSATKAKAIRYILRERNNRLLIVVSHQEEDARLLGARIVRLR